MRQNELSPAPGSRKNRKRIGRGDGSGHGTTAGKGIRGQKSGNGLMPKSGFEGGQTPMIMRLPKKRGFFNPFRQEYSVVNVEQLGAFDAGSEVTAEKLLAMGLIQSMKHPVKVLGDGEIKVALTVKARKFSASAKSKIEAAGGKAEEVGDESKAD